MRVPSAFSNEATVRRVRRGPEWRTGPVTFNRATCEAILRHGDAGFTYQIFLAICVDEPGTVADGVGRPRPRCPGRVKVGLRSVAAEAATIPENGYTFAP